ncbi:MAG: hypothetical protein N2554_09220 [Fimbriimonadales bacterium]|nr:hypothetical protein [Fimbriimonadales bacterium]
MAMEPLFPHIWDWFRQKRDYFEVFAAADSRVEGWFKAELLMLITLLTKQGVIEGFEREANIPVPASSKRVQVDFRIFAHGQEHLCELKRCASAARRAHPEVCSSTSETAVLDCSKTFASWMR